MYEEAIQLKPEEPLYYSNKAAAYIEMGSYEQAHEELNRAERLFDEDKVNDYIKKAKVYARRASIYNKQGNYGDAIAYYDKSLVEDQNQKVRDELKLVKKLQKEKEAKEYINPELGEKACEQGNTFFKEGIFSEIFR